MQGPSGCSAHVRALAKAFSAVADTRVYAACKADHRGVFGEDQPAWVGGVPGWPSWLSRYRELREVWAARRVGRRLVEDGLSGWMPDLVVERHTLFSDAGWRASTRLHVPHARGQRAAVDGAGAVRDRTSAGLARAGARSARSPAIAAVSRWLVRRLRSEVVSQRALGSQRRGALPGDWPADGSGWVCHPTSLRSVLSAASSHGMGTSDWAPWLRPWMPGWC